MNEKSEWKKITADKKVSPGFSFMPSKVKPDARSIALPSRTQQFPFFDNTTTHIETGKIMKITPMKKNEIHILEDIMETPKEKNLEKLRPSQLNSPYQYKPLEKREFLYSDSKNQNFKEESEEANKNIFEGSNNFSQNEFDNKEKLLYSFGKSDIVRNMNMDNIEVPVVNIPFVPIKKLGCNCKNSQCLKLYCECFRNNITCKNCNCLNCHNKPDDILRINMVKAIKEKNPNAFEPKFKTKKIPLSSHISKLKDKTMTFVVSRGCNCKNSNCIKKYCECFQFGVKCGVSCTCQNCKNFDDKAVNPIFEDLRIMNDQGGFGKKDEFDIKTELKRKLLEIKEFKTKDRKRVN